MSPRRYSPAERAREKAASRDQDARAIAEGEKTAEQVHHENASFAFPGARIRLPTALTSAERTQAREEVAALVASIPDLPTSLLATTVDAGAPPQGPRAAGTDADPQDA